MRPLAIALLFVHAASAETTLSLKEALTEALAGHPALAGGAGRVAAAEGLRTQAALRPNPILTIQTENLRAHGSPPFSFGQDADTYLYARQLLETSGKRARRVEVAESGIGRSKLEFEQLRRQIANRVKLAYWNAVAAQKIRDLLRENIRMFQQIVEYHEIRVREGAMAEADLLRVRLESNRLAIAANSAALEAEKARIQLFREMGRNEFPEAVLSDSLESPPPAEVDGTLDTALENRLEMRMARQQQERARSALRLEQALVKPDVEALFGYKRASGFNTVVGGIQIDLPFWKRNQGSIAAASAEVKVAGFDLAAAAAAIRAEVRSARTEYEIRSQQVVELLQPLRERARESERIALAAYREGGTDLLRLLDAERLRFDAEVLYYQTLAQYKQSEVALEAALGVAP